MEYNAIDGTQRAATLAFRQAMQVEAFLAPRTPQVNNRRSLPRWPLDKIKIHF
jgi:hypothetical protein